MNFNHKDRNPLDTVKHIKKILKEYGVSIKENKYLGNGNNLFSIGLTIEGVNWGVCGKGITKEFALASAYGELMERLQNLGLYGSSIYPKSADCLEIDIDKAIDMKKIVAQDHYKTSAVCYTFKNSPTKKIYGYPFYHYNSNSIMHLPVTHFIHYTSSTGWASGNTPEEAIVQGLCECYERYALKTILGNKDIILPTVPTEKISQLKSYSIIQQLDKKGLKVIVKDCTLSGQVPVIGCLFIKKDGSMVDLRMGSDPSLDVAIQRCLTEQFQGFNHDERFENVRMRAILPIGNKPTSVVDPTDIKDSDIYKTTIMAFGNISSHLLKNKGEDCTDKIFVKEAKTNKEMLQHLLTKVMSDKWDLFIRDMSYMGFPTYRVYVPGMCEKYNIFELMEKYDYFKNCFKSVNENYNQLSNQWFEELYNRALENKDILFYLIQQSSYDFSPGDIGLSNIGGDFLLAALALRLENYDAVYEHLLDYRRTFNNGFDPEYIRYLECFTMYTRFKRDGLDKTVIEQTLEPIYDRVLVNTIQDDLAESGGALKNIFATINNNGKKEQTDRLAEILENLVKKKIDQTQLEKICN